LKLNSNMRVATAWPGPGPSGDKAVDDPGHGPGVCLPGPGAGATVRSGHYVEAARLVARAEPGQILTTAVVRIVAGSRAGVTFTDLGSVELKGLPEPVPVCSVAWARPQAARLPLPPLLSGVGRIFVGRDDLLAELVPTYSLGILDATLGRHDSALERFAEAEAIFDRIGAPAHLGRTRVSWAGVLLDRNRPGDAAEARTRLTEALTAAREQGHVCVERRAERLLGGLCP